MRHRLEGRKLGREADHRRAMLRNIVKSLVINERIVTTHARASEVKKIADRIVTYGKKGSIHHQRLIYSVLQNRDLVKRFMTEIMPKLQDRNSGYTRVLRKGLRKGDGAPLSLLEWVYYSAEETAAESD